jgi:thiamine-monophosphate kinase
LETLGERRAIELIIRQLERRREMAVPFGDDVSASSIGNGRLAILKTDMLVGKTDVPPGMSLQQAARKAVVMNVSDFAAKGVKPDVLLVSLGLPRKLKVTDIKEIGKGLNRGAREYGAYVIGGDTGEAADLVISISLFGLTKQCELMLRSGASPGDIVAVTGLFGKPPAGLKILSNGLKAPKGIREALVESVLTPSARLEEGLALRQTRAVTAATDSSDGLAWSLHEIGRASNVGFLIEKLPIADEVKRFAAANGLDSAKLSLYGGEEYELVVTVRPTLWRKAEKAVREVGGMLLSIGKATADRNILFVTDSKKHVVEPRGYEHFRT